MPEGRETAEKWERGEGRAPSHTALEMHVLELKALGEIPAANCPISTQSTEPHSTPSSIVAGGKGRLGCTNREGLRGKTHNCFLAPVSFTQRCGGGGLNSKDSWEDKELL